MKNYLPAAAVLLGLGCSTAHSQSIKADWPTDEIRWGLTVYRAFSGAPGVYKVFEAIHFYPTRQSCRRAGDVVEEHILNSDPACKSGSCRPAVFSTCVELYIGVSGMVSQPRATP